MNNFNAPSRDPGGKQDNPWVIDDSAERDSEKTLAERLAESGVDKRILDSEYVKDTLKDEDGIADFEVSEDGKKLTLKGKNEYDDRSVDYYDFSGAREDRTISLTDSGGMTISEERRITHSFANFKRNRDKVTNEMELVIANSSIDRTIDLDESGNVVHCREVLTGTPTVPDESYTLGSVSWDKMAREKAADPDRKGSRFTDYREEITADVSQGYADIDRRVWSVNDGCRASRGDRPIGMPKHYYGNYKVSGEDGGYNLEHTIAQSNNDVMKQNKVEKEVARAQAEQEG